MSPSPGGSRRFNRVFFLLALSLCLQCLLWRGRQRIEHSTDLRHHLDSPAATFALSDHHSGARISRRFFDDDPVSNTDGSGTLLNIDYSGLYESVSPSMRWLAFIALVLWAAFLFTTIGTSASEFFCPNLSSIADRLGLSESTAGVTFLAFGNGSPDVFSTFSALRSNTFSLAIGELLGAATFITTVVVGAMALVQPFHVPRWPFIRDVGFFSVAVMLMTSCLGDGKLTLVESGGMVVLYLFYVGIVVGGNWWSRRRRNRSASTSKDAAARRTGNVYQSLPNEDIHEDTPRSSEAQSQEGVHLDRLAPSRATTTTRSLRRQRSDLPSQQAQTPSSPSSVASPELLSHSTPNLEAGATPRVSPRLRASRRPVVDAPRPTFSLLGAIEFRDALNALRRESQAGDGGGGGGAGNGGHLTVATGDDLDRISPGLDDADVAEYFGAVSPFPGGHSHHHPHIRSVSGRSVGGGRRRSLSRPISYQGTIHESPAPTALTESDRRKTVAVGEVPLSVQASTTGHDDVTESGGLGPSRLEAAQLAPEPLLNNGSKADRVLGVDRRTTPLPKLVIPDTDTDTASAKDKEYSISEDSQPVRILRGTLHMLFPSLHHFRHKSISGQIFGVFAAPALLLLTLTLPVVDDTAEGYSVNKGGVQLSMSDADDDGDVAADDTLSEAEYDEQDTRATGQAAAHLHSLIIEPSHEDRDDRESQASDARILLFNKYLTAAQCVLSPLFISSVLFCESPADSDGYPADLCDAICSRSFLGNLRNSRDRCRGTRGRCHGPVARSRRLQPILAHGTLHVRVLLRHDLDRRHRRRGR